MMGYGYDPFLCERSLKPPVFHTSTFVFRTAQDGKEFFELAYGLRQKRPNEEPGLIYSRINNPDLEMLEDRLAIWDEAEANCVRLRHGGHFDQPLGLCAAGLGHRPFGPGLWRHRFSLKRILPQFGVTPVGFRRKAERKRWRRRWTGRAIGPIAAIYLETPANPTNGLVDIGRAREICRRPGARMESARWSSSTIRCSDPCSRRRSRTAPTWS